MDYRLMIKNDHLVMLTNNVMFSFDAQEWLEVAGVNSTAFIAAPDALDGTDRIHYGLEFIDPPTQTLFNKASYCLDRLVDEMWGHEALMLMRFRQRMGRNEE